MTGTAPFGANPARRKIFRRGGDAKKEASAAQKGFGAFPRFGGEGGKPDGEADGVEIREGDAPVMEEETEAPAGEGCAVEHVPGQRVPGGGEMRPYLMPRALADAAAYQHERRVAVSLHEPAHLGGGQRAKQGHVRMAQGIGIVAVPHPAFGAGVGIKAAGDGEIVEGLAFDHGQIALVGLADALGPTPASFAFCIAGRQHKAGGGRVEAVEQAGVAFRGPGQERGEQAFKAGRGAARQGRRVHPGGLIERGKAVFFPHQRGVLSFRQGRFHLRLGKDQDVLPRPYLEAGNARLAAYKDEGTIAQPKPRAPAILGQREKLGALRPLLGRRRGKQQAEGLVQPPVVRLFGDAPREGPVGGAFGGKKRHRISGWGRRA